MKMQIIKIGNSKGIRIPAAMLKQCGITDFVDVDVFDGTINIKPSTSDKVSLDFHKITDMSDLEIQLMLRSTDLDSLAASMAGLDSHSKDRVFKNMSRRAYETLIPLISSFEGMKPAEFLNSLSESNSRKLSDLD